MRLYIYRDSPSARWGLRPQAPKLLNDKDLNSNQRFGLYRLQKQDFHVSITK
ncbi:hypothetical protein J6590_103157 [Homalodisca vitripennis]|nr:hypothetical protein J6590_103157 [Homalodisca vitripennis]